MDLPTTIGLLLSFFVGITLGFMGSGGSILTVPILVYIVGVQPVVATAYSLFIVGSTALTGSVLNSKDKNIDFNTALLFGIPSLLTVFMTRSVIVPAISETIRLSETISFSKNTFIMVLFAIVMLFSALKMIQNKVRVTQDDNQEINHFWIVLQGGIVGLVAGLVGAGGGFLIVPALMMFAKLPIRKAMGTSLIIVAIQSLIGFLGDVKHLTIDWTFLLMFCFCSIIGIFVGIRWSKKIVDAKLKKIFGWFILAMAIFILRKEIF
ncbi:sulfite exporter TauE/SafE family protein [Capnocytophaga sp. ARDL2]|uniref:sulfite exporter TauE/SafE family protein n=1 Tax=Capnocytophaga sp. ARDL2 TaxID=3238809 RepID=UPI003557194F